LKTRLNYIFHLDENFETGIFPLEMAYLLEIISQNEINFVIESGRGIDAYSTRVLNRFCNDHKIEFISIDFKPIILHKHYRKLRKANKGNSKFISGDSTILLPYLAHKYSKHKSILVLIDGPKDTEQKKLSLKMQKFNIDIVLHNVSEKKNYQFYEDVVKPYTEISNLKNLEVNLFIKSNNHNRSRDSSTLGLVKYDKLHKKIDQIQSDRSPSKTKYILHRIKLPLVLLKNVGWMVKQIFILHD
jgi:hypothetical protein